jgi:hypothetical protein
MVIYQAISLTLSLLTTEALSRMEYAAHIVIVFALYVSVSILTEREKFFLLELLTDDISRHRRPNDLIQILPRN